MSPSAPPRIEIFVHTDCGDLDPGRLEERAILALPHCLRSRGREEPVLGDLEEIEVSLVSDETIAEIHREFLDDPTPTDVITFPHGEIFLSIDTARREAPAHGHGVEEEALLYLIHGLLHLNGHIDLKEPDRTEMHRVQEEILQALR